MLYMVERYLPGGRMEIALDDAARVISACDRQSGKRSRIRYLGSTIVREDETCYSFFRAQSADAVRQLFSDASVPINHVGEALRITPREVALQLRTRLADRPTRASPL